MKFDPPRLTQGPLTGAIYVVTHGKIRGHDPHGREIVEASVKYDVTDQFRALAGEDGEAEVLLRVLVERLEHCEIKTDAGDFDEIEALMGDAKMLVGDA